MQLSGEEFRRVSQVDEENETRASAGFGTMTTARASRAAGTSRWRDADYGTDRELVRHVAEEVAQLPDVREQIVASLRERIESGDYNVTGEQIAEMMVRRHLTDRIR